MRSLPSATTHARESPLTETIATSAPQFRRTGHGTPSFGGGRFELALAEPPPGPQCFIHRDYHPENVAECQGLADGTRGILTVGGLLLADNAVPHRSMKTPGGAAGPQRMETTPVCERTQGQFNPRKYRIRCTITLAGFWSGVLIKENACQQLCAHPDTSNPQYLRGGEYRDVPFGVGATWGSGIVVLDATNWISDQNVVQLSFDCLNPRHRAR